MVAETDTSSFRAWLRTARRRDVVLRSARVSLLVGTLLVAINQGDVLAGDTLPMELFWKIPLTYCVPYGVSTYAAVDAILSASRP